MWTRSYAAFKAFTTKLRRWIHGKGARCSNCNKPCHFEGSIANNHKAGVDRPALEVIGQFTTCAAKFHWIAVVLTGDEKTAARAISSHIDGVDDSRSVFGDWLCAWSVRNVIEACAALCGKELKNEGSSGEYRSAKTIEESTSTVQPAPHSTEQLQRALLLLPLFPRFVYVLREVEGYSLPYVASTLKVDKEACQAALAFSCGALPQALMQVQPATQ